jgi:hypothetical protein
MRKTLPLIFVCVLLTAAVGRAESTAPDFNWSGRVSSQDDVEIQNLNGPVSLVRATGDTLAVTAIRTAGKGDPNSIHIVVKRDRQGILICSIFPGQDDADCSRSGGSHAHRNGVIHDDEMSVAFRIQLPARVAVSVKAVNGSVEAHDLASPVDVSAVNGHVSISTSSYARAHTVNGSIHVSMGDANWPDNTLSFASVNGSIDLTVPSSTGAHLHFKTMHGSITSDFAVVRREAPFGLMQYADATIGTGKRSLELTTLNGSIRLAKGP